MTALNKQALREAAEKATQGQWVVEFDDEVYSTNGVNNEQIAMVFSENEARDAEFIAAANPATVLALLDENESMARDLVARNCEIEGLRQHIAELEARYKPKFVKCWSCKHDIEVLAIVDCDGYCPRCAAPIDLDDEPYAGIGAKGE